MRRNKLGCPNSPCNKNCKCPKCCPKDGAPTGPTGPCCTGPTGFRGPTGFAATGPTGPCCTGPTGESANGGTAAPLPFSGVLNPAAGDNPILPVVSYLANPGFGLGGVGLANATIAPRYPLPTDTTFGPLAVNLSTLINGVPTAVTFEEGESIIVELVTREDGTGIEVETGLRVEFGPGDPMIQFDFDEVEVDAGDTYDLRVTTSAGLVSATVLNLSATLVAAGETV